jgi:hypothetical protein
MLHFSSNGQNITIQKEQGPVELIQVNVLDSFDIDNLRRRFVADIIKDGSIPGSPINTDGLRFIIQNCFGLQFQGNYHNTLLEIDRLMPPQVNNDFETVLKNVLKTSTVGSNTQISDAQYSFWESGFATKNICRRTDVITVGTPASILDSINKEEPQMWFPDPGQQIIFDQAFTARMGFPTGLTWSCTGTQPGSYNVTIDYGNQNGIITSEISRGNRGNFQPYSEGNKEKNQIINGLINRGNTNCNEYSKILITKELGDVAQIWLYLAFILIQFPEQRTQALMVTTDSVVYLFCKILFLPCVYTGSREGVTSGGCTLKHFLPGAIDYREKLRNMLSIYFNRILANNTAIIIGLRIMNLDPNKFIYYRKDGDRIRRTYGSYLMQRQQYNGLFEQVIQNIETNNQALQELYQQSIAGIPPPPQPPFQDNFTDANVTEFYNAFCLSADQHKSEQFITKLKGNIYLLNPGPLLNEFTRLISVIPATIDELLVEAANNRIEFVPPPSRGGKGKRISKKKIGGNGTGFMDEDDSDYMVDDRKYDSDEDDSIFMAKQKGEKLYYDYYECLIMCWIYNHYKEYFQQLFVNDNLQNAFASLYDTKVSLLNNNTNVDDVFPTISHMAQSYDEEFIVTMGSRLSNFINFSEDFEEEIHILKKDFDLVYQKKSQSPVPLASGHNYQTRSKTSSTGVNFVNPSIFCDGLHDILTNNKIPVGKGIYLNRRCYNVDDFKHTPLQIHDSSGNLIGFKDPYTRQAVTQKQYEQIYGLLVQQRAGKKKSIRKRTQKKSKKSKKTKKQRK